MFTGHFASWIVEPRARRPGSKMLGFTQFVRILNFFERPIGKGEHYGLNGQWIQDPAAGGGRPFCKKEKKRKQEKGKKIKAKNVGPCLVVLRAKNRLS